jgi:hypothetical protein
VGIVTEKQFQFVCKAIYRVIVATLILQVVACVIMFWMSWHEIPGHQKVAVLLGVSVFSSWGNYWAKKSFFKREEVGLGVGGTTGIMYSLGTNVFWWCGYLFFEMFFVLCAIWLYFKAVWL